MVIQLVDILCRAVMVGVASSVTVGPVAILTIQRTLSRGRSAGVYSALGVSSVDTILAMISYLFYSMVRQQLDEYSFVLRLVGGVIVGFIGISIMLRNPVTQIRNRSRTPNSPWRDYISIAGLTFANFIAVIPYILAFFALFHIQPIAHVTKYDDVINSVVVIGGFLLGSVLWWFSMVFGVDKLRNKFRLRHLAIINRVAGGIILLLGLSTIVFTLVNR